MEKGDVYSNSNKTKNNNNNNSQQNNVDVILSISSCYIVYLTSLIKLIIFLKNNHSNENIDLGTSNNPV